MTTKTETLALALCVTFESNASYGRYFHANAEIVILDPAYSSDPDYPGFRRAREDYEEERGYTDLRAHSQSDEQCGTGSYAASYAWETAYHQPHAVDARRAEAMLKTLRMLERKFEQYRSKFGPAGTFGAYVVRFAQAVGAQAVYVQTRKDARSYAKVQPGEAVYYIDSRISDWCREQHPELASA